MGVWGIWGFGRFLTALLPTSSHTQPDSMKLCECGLQRRPGDALPSHSLQILGLVSRVVYISLRTAETRGRALCLLSPLILQPLHKVEHQRLHFLSRTVFAPGSWSVLQRLWNLCYRRPFSQKHRAGRAKDLLEFTISS